LPELVLHGSLSPQGCQVLWSPPHVDFLSTDQMQKGGLLVDRGAFDTLVTRAAALAGVSVLQPATARAASLGGA
jgi:hypothetical protein